MSAAGRADAAAAIAVWRRQIELPRYLRKVHGIEELQQTLTEVLGQLSLERPRLLSGPTVTATLASKLSELSPAPPLVVHDNSRAEVDATAAELEGFDVALAIGGGRTVDVAKSACEQADVPVIAVPTQLTADGIASPVSVIRAHSGQVESRRARLPIGVVVDLDLVVRSSPERTRAGLGDLVANVCAVRDWRLAAAAGRETVDDFAALLSASAAELVRGTDVGSLGAGRPEPALLERLLDGLVLSGLAMEIAGSSRPCSGSEHLISHALDARRPGTATHGEQVAFGAIVCSRLQGEDWRALRAFLLAAGMDEAADGFGVPLRELATAIGAAPGTRPERYTVLDESDLSNNALAALLSELLGRAA